MCIAAIIFKKLSREYLRHMDTDNPHGGGIACMKNGRLFFLKGLTGEAVYELQEAGALSYPYLLHFRWATQGDKIPEWCHPFPVGPRALMGETAGFTDELIIHNGTWHNEAEWIPLVSELPDNLVRQASDTAIAAWLMKDHPEILDEVQWATAHAVVKDGQMDITTRGTWVDHDGNWYSNLNWLPANKTDWSKWYETSHYGREYNGFSPQTRSCAAPPDRAGMDCDEWAKWEEQNEEWDRFTKSEAKKADKEDSKNYGEWDSWEDYCAWRYGKDVEEAVTEADAEKAFSTYLQRLEASEMMDSGPVTVVGKDRIEEDPVSDDPAIVNKWLEGQMD